MRALLILAALLLLQENGCSPTASDKNGICSECHLKSICCHINEQIDTKALRAAWESSFNKSLLKETFNGCPHLSCVHCHPRLTDLELRHPDRTSLC